MESSTPTHWLCLELDVTSSAFPLCLQFVTLHILKLYYRLLVESSTPTHLLCMVDFASSAFPHMLQFVTLYIEKSFFRLQSFAFLGIVASSAGAFFGISKNRAHSGTSLATGSALVKQSAQLSSVGT